MPIPINLNTTRLAEQAGGAFKDVRLALRDGRLFIRTTTITDKPVEGQELLDIATGKVAPILPTNPKIAGSQWDVRLDLRAAAISSVDDPETLSSIALNRNENVGLRRVAISHVTDPEASAKIAAEIAGYAINTSVHYKYGLNSEIKEYGSLISECIPSITNEDILVKIIEKWQKAIKEEPKYFTYFSRQLTLATEQLKTLRRQVQPELPFDEKE